MNKFTLVLAAAVLAMATWFIADGRAFARGMKQGALAEAAKRDSALVSDLSKTINAAKGLADTANASSQKLRQSVSTFETNYQPVIKEFNDALTASASSRAGCVFSPGVMRQLQAAQQRAATAAQHGLPGSSVTAVPGAAKSAGGTR